MGDAERAARIGNDGGKAAALGELVGNGLRDFRHRSFDQDDVIGTGC